MITQNLKYYYSIMNCPELVIFDIDDTLLTPDYYTSLEHIKKGLFDSELLGKFLEIPEKYQIAIASFNSDPQPHIFRGIYSGRRLGRAILDIQYPQGDTKILVPDEFIQAWVYSSFKEMFTYGKNKHVQLIINAYRNKYSCDPPKIYLYDDLVENIYLANKIGVIGCWTPKGVTRNNLNGNMTFGNKIQFGLRGSARNIATFFKNCRYIIRSVHSSMINIIPLYTIYLDPNPEIATTVYNKFVSDAVNHKLIVHLVN